MMDMELSMGAWWARQWLKAMTAPYPASINHPLDLQFLMIGCWQAESCAGPVQAAVTPVVLLPTEASALSLLLTSGSYIPPAPSSALVFKP